MQSDFGDLSLPKLTNCNSIPDEIDSTSADLDNSKETVEKLCIKDLHSRYYDVITNSFIAIPCE